MTAAGTIVGSRYRLEKLIAQGGMGEVWKASHLSLLFPVAIKFAMPSGGDERFARESRIAATIRHPNVVSVMDDGVTDEGALFLVMEHLVGESLASRLCRPTPLGVDELLRVIAQTLRGLQAVHNAGVVHRDLKPENIFVVMNDDQLDAKLLDFGVAHADPSSAVAIPISSLTVTGCTVGTPWYMAPEQARGLDVTATADLFSVAVILYRALTGKFPFEGATLADIVLKSVTTKPTPPHTLRPELGTQLSDIVLRALAVDPTLRFPDAQSMRIALEACDLPGVQAAVLPASLSQHGRSPSVTTRGLGKAPVVPAIDPPSRQGQPHTARPRMTLPEFEPVGAARVQTTQSKPRRKAATLGALALVLAMVGGTAWYFNPMALPPRIQIVSETTSERSPLPMAEELVQRSAAKRKDLPQSHGPTRSTASAKKRPVFRNPGF